VPDHVTLLQQYLAASVQKRTSCRPVLWQSVDTLLEEQIFGQPHEALKYVRLRNTAAIFGSCFG
jgi:hypothetical protein